MKIFIAGLGPGKPELITLEALNAAKISDVIITPRTSEKISGVAEKIITQFLPDKKILPVIFPMINDTEQRDKLIFQQLEKISCELSKSEKIFFPVIGDAMLFSTGAYLLEALQKIFPNLEAEFIPGISAHSLAASCAKKFLAMGGEILSIIPGTADPEKISRVMKFSDAVAIYKPTAIKNLPELAADFKKIFRIDFAGIPEKEKITTGQDALKNIHKYLSIILLWR